MRVFVFVSFVFVCVYMCGYVFVCVCAYVYLCVFMCLYVYVCVFVSVWGCTGGWLVVCMWCLLLFYSVCRSLLPVPGTEGSICKTEVCYCFLVDFILRVTITRF